MSDQSRLYTHPAMQALKKAVKRETRLQLFAALALTFIGVFICYQSFETNGFLVVLGLVGVIIGLRYTFRMATQWRVEHTRLMQLLLHNPKQIVWVYSTVTQHMPFGFQFINMGTLYFKLIDGDEISVSLKAKDLKIISRFLNRLLPHATFGFSKDKEQWFMAAPEMLIRGDKDK